MTDVLQVWQEVLSNKTNLTRNPRQEAELLTNINMTKSVLTGEIRGLARFTEPAHRSLYADRNADLTEDLLPHNLCVRPGLDPIRSCCLAAEECD